MEQENVLPSAEAMPADAVAGDQAEQAQLPENQTEGEESQEAKAEKSPLEKELAKERRRINNLVRQREEARARAQQLEAEFQRLRPASDNASIETGDEVTLTREQLKQLVQEHAKRIAPEISSQAAQQKELVAAASKLQKELGSDWQAVTEDLASLMGDDLQLAVLSADAPAELARYLTDPDNADEAEAIGRMSPIQAGRAFAKIEAKLAAKASKPEASKAPAPLDSVRGSGKSIGNAPSDTRAYIEWANKQYGRI